MKYVLFVDDDPNVLAGLKRMLRGLRNEWIMEFVDSGEKALAYMSTHPVTAMITDMRMPVMDGAQLLKEVTERYPAVVRIVLSGQSDKETLLTAAGLAHQYLSKPCDTDTLKLTVRRACALRDCFSDETLKRLMARINSIPSLPTNYQEILQELNSPEPSLSAVGAIISRDVAMTAKVLQLVNSAFFGVARRITNPTQAVSLLGLETVSGLVLTASVFTQFDHGKCARFDADEVMEHCLAVAAMAKSIAGSQTKDANLINDAFVAGLLHDVGKLVLASNFPNEYGQALLAADDLGQSLNVVEEEMFGANHADVGSYILGLWGLPPSLIEAVAFHHDPLQALGIGFTPLTAVHVADALVHAAEETPTEGKALPIDEQYLKTIGVYGALPTWQSLPLPKQRQGAKA